MKRSDTLSRDARALLRAARGGDDISASERQRVLQTFRERAALDDVAADAAASAPRRQAPRASRSRQRRPLPRPVKRAAWALAAVISSGSLAALAHEGVFADWGAAIARMLGTRPSESSIEGARPAVDDRAARRAPSASAPTQAPTESLAGENARAAGPAQAPRVEPRNAERARAAGVADDDSALATPEAAANRQAITTAPLPPGANEARVRQPSSSAPRSSENRETVGRDISRRAQVESAPSHTSAAPRREPARALTNELPASLPTAPDPSTSAELDLIVAARNALGARRHADARAAAERHALQFPEGLFGEEREAILALCGCRESGSSARARAFIERRPDSLFAERIRRDCKLASNSVPDAPAAGTHQESPPRSGAR